MRRLLVASLFFAVLVPTALALVFADADWEAIRCAARCGHEVRSGSACCPVSGSATHDNSISSCPSGESSPARTRALPPSILAVAMRLTSRSGDNRTDAVESIELASVVPDPPEHVPLAVS